jgi:hypothetical protein
MTAVKGRGRPDGTNGVSDSSKPHMMMTRISTRNLMLALVLAASLAACGGSDTGVLTGKIGFVGRVPPKSLLSRNEVIVLREGVSVARQPLHLGQPYRFTLAPGDYTIHLRGADNSKWGNIGRVQAGRTTQMNLTLVFHGSVPVQGTGIVQVPLSTFSSITVRVPAVTPPDEVVSDSNGERCLKPYEEITISPTGTPYKDFVFDLGVNNNGDPVVEDVAASNTSALGPNNVLCYFPGERAP